MVNVKYQIFISSTYEDLKKEREQVIRAILEMGHIPVGMEMFSAGDETQWQTIQRQIEQSDYYIVIVAHRYGSQDGDVSYTEKEWQYAISKNIPIIALIIEPTSPWPPDFIDSDNLLQNRLNLFKQKLRNKMVSFWVNTEDLYGKASIALMKQINVFPRVGWMRADASAGPEVVNELSRLSGENAELRRLVSEKDKQSIRDEESRIEEIITTLSVNKRNIPIWYSDEKDWITIPDITLYAIFELCGPYLLSEVPVEQLGKYIAITVGKFRPVRTTNPVPVNSMKSWMSDLACLELIKPSEKRKSVHDSNEYWTFTELGEIVFKNLRKNKLKRGIIIKEPQADESTIDKKV